MLVFVIQISLEGSNSNRLNCCYYCNCYIRLLQFSTVLWCKGMLLVWFVVLQLSMQWSVCPSVCQLIAGL